MADETFAEHLKPLITRFESGDNDLRLHDLRLLRAHYAALLGCMCVHERYKSLLKSVRDKISSLTGMIIRERMRTEDGDTIHDDDTSSLPPCA